MSPDKQLLPIMLSRDGRFAVLRFSDAYYDCDAIKNEAIAAGLAVIDSRMVEFDLAARLAVCGPMIAVNEAPAARPWHGLSYAPLEAVAAAYRKAGAEVLNIPESPEHDGVFDTAPPGPAAQLVDFWLGYVRAHGA